MTSIISIYFIICTIGLLKADRWRQAQHKFFHLLPPLTYYPVSEASFAFETLTHFSFHFSCLYPVKLFIKFNHSSKLFWMFFFTIQQQQQKVRKFFFRKKKKIRTIRKLIFLWKICCFFALSLSLLLSLNSKTNQANILNFL